MYRYYLHCPVCGARMHRTGKKIEDAPAMSKDREAIWLYRREYECPRCGNFFTYSEYHNAIVPGEVINEKCDQRE
jgi:hypothetical protein